MRPVPPPSSTTRAPGGGCHPVHQLTAAVEQSLAEGVVADRLGGVEGLQSLGVAPGPGLAANQAGQDLHVSPAHAGTATSAMWKPA